MAASGFLKIADTRDQRFEGKVTETTALCRGGQKAVQFRMTPWVDWSQYWGTGDMSSLPPGFSRGRVATFNGVTGALLDLEYQRIELIKFNLFDNNGTYQTYVTGRGGRRRPGTQDMAGDAPAKRQHLLHGGRRAMGNRSAQAT